MTHKELTATLNADLDDLKVRNPMKYREIERKLKMLEIEAGFAVATAGVRSMERLP